MKKVLVLMLALAMLCPTASADVLGFGGEWGSGSWGVSQLPGGGRRADSCFVHVPQAGHASRIL